MKKPVLDNRDPAQLAQLFQRRAREYTPQWRYEPGGDEPGAAIAQLFLETFGQTIDRFNQIPEKAYVEFLKLLGVNPPPVTPASGYIRFGVGGAGEAAVRVPQGTEVFAPVEGEDSIIFSTRRTIEVTGAKLEQLYFADAGSGRIERITLDEDMPFFSSAGGENLQLHRLSISQNEVLALTGPCTLSLRIRQKAAFTQEETLARLAHKDFAQWRYFDGQQLRSFSRVSLQNGALLLEKQGEDALRPDEQGRICLYCDMIPAQAGEIVLDEVLLQSEIPKARQVDTLANNNIPITLEEGGYCFGRRPAQYELFYIRCDDVFSKRGARVSLQLEIHPVIHSSVDTGPQYEFNKRIIDKNNAVTVVPDDVFVEQVVWEYHNGTGWTVLEVAGNKNPFSCKETGPLMVIFTLPQDMQPSVVNAQEGLHIRARVINVENYLSIQPRWVIPFVTAASCSFQYTGGKRPDYLSAQNNHELIQLENAAQISDLALKAYAPLQPHPKAMYLCFDSSPHALPLSILFQVMGRCVLGGKLLYEVWTGKQFESVRSIDSTDNLFRSGLVQLYIPDALPVGRFFGKSGHWLRISLSSMTDSQRPMPRLKAIGLNTVSALQMQTAAPQRFDTGAYEGEKVIELLETPVLACRVLVDEAGGLSQRELAALQEQYPQELETEYEGSSLTRCWVPWRQVSALDMAGPEARVYELDSLSGRIKFGNGEGGAVPPPGDLNIRVEYQYGGGSRGNVAEGAIRALVGSIAKINAVSNIAPMSGGTDPVPMSRIEALGNKRFRHRQVAVSTLDYEELVLETFPRTAHARCFSSMDENGVYAPGHVCLVVMGRQFSNEAMTMELCREIYDYLAPRSDCNLIETGRLHVVPSIEITIHVEVTIQLEDLEQAAITQQRVSESIGALINTRWCSREIGRQIDIRELYEVVKNTPNVALVERIFPEGVYQSQGRIFHIPLEEEVARPFATVKNGVHTVKIVYKP